MKVDASTCCGDGPDVLVKCSDPRWKVDFQQLLDGSYTFGLTADEALELATKLILAAGKAKDFWHEYDVASAYERTK